MKNPFFENSQSCYETQLENFVPTPRRKMDKLSVKMKYAYLLVVFLSLDSFSENLKLSAYEELPQIPGTLYPLYSSKIGGKDPVLLSVVRADKDMPECRGKIESCPDARLFLAVSTKGLYGAQKFYELPPAKGWELVSKKILQENSIEILLKTTLPKTNIDPVERKSWASKTYRVIVKPDIGPTFSVM